MTIDPHTSPPPDGAALIDAYLDGTLGPAERAAMERRLETDAALRAELELQRRIDGRLRAVMAPPAEMPLPAPTHVETVPVAGSIRPRRAFSPALKAAAVLLVAGVAAWAVVDRPWQRLGTPPARLAMDEVRQRLVSTGFEPKWVCADDAQMLAYTRDHLGTPLTIRRDKGVELVGWDYLSGLLSDHAQVLMAKVDGQPSLVVMDHKDADHRQRASAPGLHLHRREVGDLVMYELSPRPTPAVLPGVAVKE